MKILFLTNLLPYPLDNGGKIKTYTTICALSKAGHEIDLVCFSEKKDPDKSYQKEIEKLCASVHQVYLRLTTAENMPYMMKLAVKSLFSMYSFGLYKYQSTQMQEVLQNLCKTQAYDCVYFDHLQLCIYETVLKQFAPNARYILDEHNCEALIMERNASTAHNSIKKAFLKLEAIKLKNFESRMLQSMDMNIVLSKEDLSALQKQCGKTFQNTIIPIGVKDCKVKEIKKNENFRLNILFLGTLTWEANNQGLIWYLANVMPLINEKKICETFYIVGKNPSAEVRKLAEQYTNVVITGYVESVDEYYEKCDCMVVPLFIGSGQRVKLIESFSKGMPAVSTSVGAEGLEAKDMDNIMIANTENEFVSCIQKMMDVDTRRNISRKARMCYERNYSPSAIADKLNAVMEQIEKS